MNRKSPTSSVSRIDSEGIRNACRMKMRTIIMSPTAHTSDSKFSRIVELGFVLAFGLTRRSPAAVCALEPARLDSGGECHAVPCEKLVTVIGLEACHLQARGEAHREHQRFVRA